jgi:hypothetical protein
MNWDIFVWLGAPQDPMRPWWFGWATFGFTAFVGASICLLYWWLLKWADRYDRHKRSERDYTEARWWP